MIFDRQKHAIEYFQISSIDVWHKQIQSMDNTVWESLGLSGYGRKDPLIEHKQKGYEMFLEMTIGIRRNVVYSMLQLSPER
jgi:preprotein translocase subunit SecA